MKRAFTLIELLVVIAIIAILAAILFPVFAQAKVAAKKTTNLSNIKQDNLATIMYGSDADDVLAPVQSGLYDPGTMNETNTQNRGQLIYPYTKNYQLLRNPLDGNQNDATLYDGATTELKRQFNATQRDGHGYNFFYCSPLMDVGGNAVFIGKSATSFGRPANTIMTVDSVWDMGGVRAPKGGGNWFVQAPSYWNSGTSYWFGPWAFTDQASWFQFGGAFDYAKGQVVTSYVDGHAKSIPTPQLWAGADPTTSSVIDESKYLWGGTS